MFSLGTAVALNVPGWAFNLTIQLHRKPKLLWMLLKRGVTSVLVVGSKKQGYSPDSWKPPKNDTYKCSFTYDLPAHSTPCTAK